MLWKDETSYDDITYRSDEDKSGSLSPFTFLCFALVLVLSGLVFIYSISFPSAVRSAENHYAYFLNQLIGAAAGFLIGLLLYFMPIRALKKAWAVILPLSYAALALNLLGYSEEGNIILFGTELISAGSLSFSAIIFLAASVIPRRIGKDAALCFIALFASLAFLLFSAGIIWYIIASLAVIALYISNRTSRAVLLLYGFILAAAGIFAVLFFDVTGLSEGDLGNLMLASRTLRTAGVTGSGFGSALASPFPYEDPFGIYIIPSIAREMGYIGIAFIAILFAFVFILGIRTAGRGMRKGDPVLGSLSLGLTLMIILKAVSNMVYVMGVPLGKVTLPFYGYSVAEEALNTAAAVLLYRLIYILGRENAKS